MERVRRLRFRESPRGKRALRAYAIERTYGISHEQFDVLVAKQNNECAICAKSGLTERSGYLSIDHDHSTGKIRGLLCDGCNVGLGKFKDDIEELRKAITYLMKA